MDTGQYKTTATHLRISGISAFYLSYLRIPPFCGQATGFHRTSLHGRRKRTTSRLIERSHTIVVPLPRLYPEIGITVQHLFFINGDVFKIILTGLRTLNYVSIGRESRRRLPFEKDLPYRGVRLQPFRHSRDRQRRINGGLQGKRQRTISEMILTAMFRTQQFRHTLTIRCRNAFQYLIMIINQLPHRPFAQNSQGINGGPTVVHLLTVVVINKGHTSHLVMTCHIFRPGQQTVTVIPEQVVALVPCNLAHITQKAHSQLGMGLVSSAFLPLAEHRAVIQTMQKGNSIPDTPVAQAILIICHPFVINILPVA